MSSSLLVILAAMTVFVWMFILRKLWKTFWQEYNALSPDTLPLDQYRQHRQTVITPNLTNIIIFLYDVILSNHTTMSGAKGYHDSHLPSTGVCTIGYCYQMTWTPGVPGSPPEPWHCLWLILHLLSVMGRVAIWVHCCSSFLLTQ